MAGDRPFLVFDIGGTSLRAAIYDPGTQHIDRLTILDMPSLSAASNRSAALAEIVDMLTSVADGLMPATEPHSVCVGFPGPVDKDGNVYAAPTIWGFQYLGVLPLKQMISGCWPAANIEIVNDVTAAGYYFVDDVTRDFLVVTVGSGIGSKVFMNGQPIVGPNSRGGEIGHLRVDFSADALTCDCGGTGHLGAIASGRGVLRSAIHLAGADPASFRRSQLHRLCAGRSNQITNEMLVEAFTSGDPWTREIIEACTGLLGRVLAGIHLSLGLESYKLTGGFAAALGDEYRQMLAESATASTWRNGFSWSDAIHVSKPDDHPGLNGGGRLLQMKYGRT